MNATELQKENSQLKKLLEQARSDLSQTQSDLSQTQSDLSQTQSDLSSTRSQHAAEQDQFHEQLQGKDQEIRTLRHEVKQLLLKIRGSRQERIDPDQLLLFSTEELQEIAAQLKQGDPGDDLIDTDPSQGKRRLRKKRTIPAFLKRIIKRHELNEHHRACPCCGEQRHEIGVQASEQLEIIPAQFYVIRHERVKYACRRCDRKGTSGQVVIAPKPPQPIEKGLPGPALCAYTVLSKFGDHQPLYRMEDLSSRFGFLIRRSSFCTWQAQLATLSLALVMRMKHLLLESKVVFTDDTSIKLITGKGKAKTAKFWPYLGDSAHPYVVFDFTETRQRDGPQSFLNGYKGYLQADAFSGYDCVYASGLVKEVACWVHARRYWHKAQDSDPLRSSVALGYIARLSQIEKELRRAYPSDLSGHRDFAAVAAGRQEFAKPILDEFKTWLDEETKNKKILPKSPLRAAFTYTENQWLALNRYLDEGFLLWDNNISEREVKPAAIGRKNYLFVGSVSGGERAAIHYSLVNSAKRNGVEPFAWLKSVFERLPYHRDGEAFAQASSGDPVTSKELDYLLPDLWLKANPDHAWDIANLRRQEREKRN